MVHAPLASRSSANVDAHAKAILSCWDFRTFAPCCSRFAKRKMPASSPARSPERFDERELDELDSSIAPRALHGCRINDVQRVRGRLWQRQQSTKRRCRKQSCHDLRRMSRSDARSGGVLVRPPLRNVVERLSVLWRLHISEQGESIAKGTSLTRKRMNRIRLRERNPTK